MEKIKEKAPKPQPGITSKIDVRSSMSLNASKRIKLRRSWNPPVLDKEVEKLEKTSMKFPEESSAGEKSPRKRKAKECLLMDEAKKPIASPFLEFEQCACKSPLLAPEVPVLEEWHVSSPEACFPNTSSISPIKLSIIAEEVENMEKTILKVPEKPTTREKPAKKRKAEESLPTEKTENPIDSQFHKLEPRAHKSPLLAAEVPVLEEGHAPSPKRLKRSLEAPVPEACFPNTSPISTKLCEMSSPSLEESVSAEDDLEKLMDFGIEYFEDGMDLEYGKTIEELLQELQDMIDNC